MEPLSPISRPWPLRPTTIAMLCHLAAFAGYLFPFGHIVGPLVVWLLKRHVSPVVDQHGKEAVNFQISVTIYLLLALPLAIIVVGIPLVAAIIVFDVVCVIIAAIRASDGIPHRYPLSIRLIG